MARALRKRKKKRRRSVSNKVRNGSFKEGLAYWESQGAMPLSVEEETDVVLCSSNSFLQQTVTARPGDRLKFQANLRGEGSYCNGPVVVRLRWVEVSGTFLGPALELFVPSRGLAEKAWTALEGVTNTAPYRARKIDIRIDYPLGRRGAGVVLGKVELK